MISLIHFHPQLGNDRTDTVDDKKRPSAERLTIGGGLIGDKMNPAADAFNLDNLHPRRPRVVSGQEKQDAVFARHALWYVHVYNQSEITRLDGI